MKMNNHFEGVPQKTFSLDLLEKNGSQRLSRNHAKWLWNCWEKKNPVPKSWWKLCCERGAANVQIRKNWRIFINCIIQKLFIKILKHFKDKAEGDINTKDFGYMKTTLNRNIQNTFVSYYDKYEKISIYIKRNIYKTYFDNTFQYKSFSPIWRRDI